MSKPTVPEVSLIFDDSKQFTLNNEIQPKNYKVWKQQQQQQCQEPIATQPTNRVQSSDRKKIVTFDIPTEMNTEIKNLQKTSECSPIALCQQLDLSLNELPSSSIRHSIPASAPSSEVQYNRQDYNHYMPYRNENGNGYNSMPLQTKLNSAGTPSQLNQQFTPNKNCITPSKEVTLNDVYRLLQNMQISNQSSHTAPLNQKSHALNQYDSAVGELDNRNQHPNHMSGVPNGEPTVRDVFNVILKQQEQLMNLQSQVQLLLMHTANTPKHQQNDNPPHCNRISHAHTNTNCNENEARNKQMSVMTSLEINVQNAKSNGVKSAAATTTGAMVGDATNYNTPKKSMRAAIMGNQSVKQCDCVCNCAQQNHGQSSDSGSNDDNLDVSPDHGETQTGWTFYGNILNQVNDVLQSTPPTANANSGDSDVSPNVAANIENRYHNLNNVLCKNPYGMPKQIRTAQFKQVGFQIDDVNISAMSKR